MMERTAGGTGPGGKEEPCVPARVVPALLFLILSVALPAAAVTASLGDTVTLAGTSQGNPAVFLFITGPNLPANGAALDDLEARAEDGGVTRVTVGDDGRWRYDWDTRGAAGFLDYGSYTVWVVNAPADRSRLRNLEYRTLQVTFVKPGLSASTSGGSERDDRWTATPAAGSSGAGREERPEESPSPAFSVPAGESGGPVRPAATAAGDPFAFPVILAAVAAAARAFSRAAERDRP